MIDVPDRFLIARAEQEEIIDVVVGHFKLIDIVAADLGKAFLCGIRRRVGRTSTNENRGSHQ